MGETSWIRDIWEVPNFNQLNTGYQLEHFLVRISYRSLFTKRKTHNECSKHGLQRTARIPNSVQQWLWVFLVAWTVKASALCAIKKNRRKMPHPLSQTVVAAPPPPPPTPPLPPPSQTSINQPRCQKTPVK